MIRSFRSRALRRFWEKDDRSKIAPEWIDRIAILLDRLDASKEPADMNLPGFDFHQLKGRDKGRYAVKVSPNYRLTFAWEDEDAIDIDLEDYH